MDIPLYQVDAFSDAVFGGNPAAVCPLEAWLADDLLQKIAAENNLSETAFFVAEGDRYHLRWFTPRSEVDLCGHATLAAAFVIAHVLGGGDGPIRFDTLSGPLTVTPAEGGLLRMEFPARPGAPVTPPAGLIEALGASPAAFLKARDYMAVFEARAAVAALAPDFGALGRVLEGDGGGVIVTAPADAGKDADFVSRFFAPQFGIDEDPVTGSAHCTLIPYWARRLGREALKARQISARGGTLYCRDAGKRVEISGHCAFYLDGVIRLP